MIPDRIIEQGTLTTSGARTAVEVRLPWYRALPGSCIAGAKLSVDGVEAPAESLRWGMNGREFSFDELSTNTDEWWFPTDSAVLSGDLPVAPMPSTRCESTSRSTSRTSSSPTPRRSTSTSTTSRP